MDKTEYAPAREPTSDEWLIRSVWIEQGRSIPKAAFRLGIERAEVIRAVMQCRDWLKDSGWDERFALAKRNGFSDSDARLHADMEALRTK